MEVRSKITHKNDIDISFIEITPNKVCRNDVDFSPIEITGGRYVSSSIYGVIRPVLNFFFFYDKISQAPKDTRKHQKAAKSTKKHQKALKGTKRL